MRRLATATKWELDIDEDFFPDLTEAAVADAVEAAMEVIKDEVEDNAETHRSEQTGTGEQQSETAKASRILALADSIEIGIGVSTPFVTGTVFVQPWAAQRAVSLEFGFNSVPWGNEDSRTPVEPKPFMRPAFDNSKERAMRTFERELGRHLREEVGRRLDGS